MVELCDALLERHEAAVDDDAALRELALQAVHARIVERRNLAILLRAQAAEPRFAGMDDERLAARRRDLANEVAHELVRVVVIDAEPRLDGHGHVNSGTHRSYTLRDTCALEHQRRAEAARLHPIARAADVEVELVVTGRRAEPRRERKLVGVAAAEL